MTSIHQGLTNIERDFNIVGSLPLIGVASGATRHVLGDIQITAGITIGLLGLGGQIVHPFDKEMQKMTSLGVEHIIHGALNSIRGVAEGICSITVVGSIIPFSIQVLSENGFNPRFGYST